MATLELAVGPNPEALLLAAADGFLVARRGTLQEPFPSPHYLLALRQGGLREDLLTLAAGKGIPGWFDPPLCVFHELPEWLGSTARRPLGDFERLVLIAHVLDRVTGDVLRRARRIGAFLDAIDRLFGELVAEGVTAEGFAAAVGKVGTREAFEMQRDEELTASYRGYLDALEREGCRDGRDTWVDCARAIAADPDGFASRLGGRREIRVVGLHDLRGGWRELLGALIASPALDRVTLYVADADRLGIGLTTTRRTIPGDAGVGQQVFTGERAEGPAVDIIAAPDPDRELEAIAVRVRALAERGVPLERIAIVARKARPYVDRAVATLERVGVPATARLRIAFTEIPVLRSLEALFAAAAAGWTRHALAELAEQPYIATDLDPTVIDVVGYRRQIRGLDAWQRALVELEADARRSSEEGRTARDADELPTPGRVRRTRAALRRFASIARALDQSRPMLAWTRWLEDLLARDPFEIESRIHAVPDRRFGIARVDLVGWRAIAIVVKEWRGALERWGDDDTPVTPAAFFERLQSLLSGDAAFWSASRRGVQVLESLAALYRSFDHLFLVGMSAGSWPARPPTSTILDQADRRALHDAGLPLELDEVWEARERSLFQILLSGARATTLSYSALDETGREVLPSAFVEAVEDVAMVRLTTIEASQVLTPGFPVLAVAELADEIRRMAQIESDRAAGRPGSYDGIIDDPSMLAWLATRYGDAYLWSPSQLEQYAKCPWAWFSHRLLNLGRREDPDEEMDPVVRGGVLHDALRRFFEQAVERTGGPVFLREADLRWAEPLARAALADALGAAESQAWLCHELLRGATMEELTRVLIGYLRWEAREVNERSYNKRTKAAQLVRTGAWLHECEFDDAALEREGIVFRYRGRVDRVDRGTDERASVGHLIAAIDYKSSQAAVPGGGAPDAWTDGVVLQVPLYAHALARLQPGASVARVEYRSLRRPKALHQLQLHQIEKRTQVLFQSTEDADRMEQALDHVPRLVRAIRRGEFPVRPAPSCGCPPFCHARDICRVPGGPRTKRDRRFP